MTLREASNAAHLNSQHIKTDILSKSLEINSNLRFKFVHPCLAALFWFFFFGFFCAHAPRETGISVWIKPPDEIARNERKQTRAGGRRARRWKDIAKEWLRPSPHASWGTICLTNWYWLPGTLELDGQALGDFVHRPNYSGWVCLISTTGKYSAVDSSYRNSYPFCLTHI